IADLVAISLRDRDDEPRNTVGNQLEDLGHSNPPDGFHCRKWRRRHIDSYLIWPPAIAAASGLPEDEIRNVLQEVYGVAIGNNFRSAHAPDALLDLRGKDVLARLAVSPYNVIDHMQTDAIPDDLRTMIQQLADLVQ